MTLKSELMAAGLPAAVASKLGQDMAATGLTASGTNQATAFVLTSDLSIFGTVASGSGCILGPRGNTIIVNGGANALLVYPPVGGNINGGALNAAISVPAGKAAYAQSNGLVFGVVVSA